MHLNACCLTWWCVTGWTVPILANGKIRASPSLTHPTGVAQLNMFVGLSGRETQQSVTGVGFHSSTQPTRRCWLMGKSGLSIPNAPYWRGTAKHVCWVER
ncbi:MAG: hypothetical protein F6K55_28270 [Moorea sp. SIO4A3]|nr:hypothetical protein [Moorena sp. SIO4A3]